MAIPSVAVALTVTVARTSLSGHYIVAVHTSAETKKWTEDRQIKFNVSEWPPVTRSEYNTKCVANDEPAQSVSQQDHT